MATVSHFQHPRTPVTVLVHAPGPKQASSSASVPTGTRGSPNADAALAYFTRCGTALGGHFSSSAHVKVSSTAKCLFAKQPASSRRSTARLQAGA